ncbi:MAG: aromatic aminobenezylarsenical efflux permease ArsG family transporter [Cyanobacteriota bacterium]
MITALWIGILASISPCTLGTNVAAVTFIGKQFLHPLKVFLSGIIYSFGRSISYIIIGYLVLKGILSVPVVANFLQKYMNIIIGPLLIIIGLLLLDLIKINLNYSFCSNERANRLKETGLPGALALGIIFSLSFCPASAGLFFGSLIPLAIKNNSTIIFPALFGIGTGLPVIVIAILMSLGLCSITKLFDKLTQFEIWARKITATIFILVGIYFISNHLLVSY